MNQEAKQSILHRLTIIYLLIKKPNDYYEKVFEGFIEIPMEDNICYFCFDSHSDILSNGNN